MARFQVNSNQGTSAGDGNQPKPMEAGIKGPCYLDIAWENLSPAGTSDAEGIAVYVNDEEGHQARIMVTVPQPQYITTADQEPTGPEKSVEIKLQNLAKVASNIAVTADDIPSMMKQFAQQAATIDTKSVPVWIKLQYNKKDYLQFGNGVFIEEYKEEKPTSLKQLDNDRFEKQSVPDKDNGSTPFPSTPADQDGFL